MSVNAVKYGRSHSPSDREAVDSNPLGGSSWLFQFQARKNCKIRGSNLSCQSNLGVAQLKKTFLFG